MAPAASYPGNLVYFAILAVFGAIAAATYYSRARIILSGRPENRLGSLRDIAVRVLTLPRYVLGTQRVNRPRYWYAGLLHTMIFWGFLTLQVRTLNFILDGFSRSISLEHFFGDVYTYYRPVMDLFNVLVLAGIGLAAYQRFVVRPRRLTLNRDAWLILFLIAFLMVTDLLTNSFAIFLQPDNDARYSFVAYGLAKVWDGVGMSRGTAEALHVVSWYGHLVDFLVFFCYLPLSKHSHILTAPLNVFFRRLTPTGVLQPIRNLEEQEVFGVKHVQDYSWKQVMDFYTCTECGRCEINCPASISGKDLSPKKIMHDLRTAAETLAELPFMGTKKQPLTAVEAVGFNPIWDCVNCGACQEQCPVFIEHIPALMDLRRNLTMDESNMPETAAATLIQLEQRGHPWRGTAYTRTSWMEGLTFEVPQFDGSQEYLFWVGCTGALVERNIRTTQAVARLLHRAGVSFGCLGAEETCSGDPARRMGNEYLYQMQAEQAIGTMHEKNVMKVIASCPHCFNTIRNEYIQFGGEFQVQHHTEVLADLVRDGRLPIAGGLQEKIAYHDSCFLGRHNQVYEPPRDVIRAIPGADLVELPRHHANGFCCGAGGGHMWVEETKGRRINHIRSEEIVASGVGVVATACPFCTQMFEDGIPAVQTNGNPVRSLDIAEILDNALSADSAAEETVT